MRRISANYVFPVDGPPIRNGIVEAEDDGTIKKVYDFGGQMKELAHTEFLNGILVPGFINMHTHLEYAWMKQIEPAGKGMRYFIEYMMASEKSDEYIKSIKNADKYMYRTGTVAIADIANTSTTKEIKAHSPIRYHTFAELTGLNPDMARERLKLIHDVEKEFTEAGLSASITPHAPYSISENLWKMLGKKIDSKQVLSIHNQESREENEMFTHGKGALLDLFRKLDIIDKQWQPSGKTALQSLPPFINNNPLLLIHNTHTTKSDINFLLQHRRAKTGWVLCPTSNEQITGELPDIELLETAKFPVMLGTDSTASGKSLSLLEEMKLLQQKLNLPFNKLLPWATINGAEFMGWDDLGSFAPGKKPGINLVSGFDFKSNTLKSTAKVRRVL